ncbi:hypothetical protein [Leptospira noguchii]|uniref:hypothetical protein n=1 Tax=Leptospira noguchii TaxID=28182 RepID=UPI0003286C7E|nr:hypothetical protein [Leptospira noguchii]EMS84060.1 hypothetical protein LEP1GSC073_2704 [Leptospira noguchii str. Cascata]
MTSEPLNISSIIAGMESVTDEGLRSATDSELGNKIFSESVRESCDNAYGHRIMFFRGKRSENDRYFTYHFHFLLTERFGQKYAICLDTDDAIPLTQKNPDESEMKSVALMAMYAFIERAKAIEKTKQHIRPEYYFTRSHEDLWKKFNTIKEKGFVDYVEDSMKNDGEEIEVSSVSSESELKFESVR